MGWLETNDQLGAGGRGREIELRLPVAAAAAKSPGQAHLHTKIVGPHLHREINVPKVRATFCCRSLMTIMNGHMFKHE